MAINFLHVKNDVNIFRKAKDVNVSDLKKVHHVIVDDQQVIIQNFHRLNRGIFDI